MSSRNGLRVATMALAGLLFLLLALIAARSASLAELGLLIALATVVVSGFGLVRLADIRHTPDTSAPRGRRRSHRLDQAFVHFLSREMRTPLNAIVGYAEILHEDASQSGRSDAQGDLGRIQKASLELMVMLEDLADLLRIDRGRVDLDVGSFALPQVVRDVEKTARALLDGTPSKLEVVVPAQMDPMRGDREKVRRSLLDVVRFVAWQCPGPVRVEVDEQTMNATRHVRVSVWNPDARLDAKQLTSLLEASPQGSLPDQPAAVGLVVAHGLCRAMGGALAVESRPGTGNAITLRLPAIIEALPPLRDEVSDQFEAIASSS
jgi:signal transduction histidine kinase